MGGHEIGMGNVLCIPFYDPFIFSMGTYTCLNPLNLAINPFKLFDQFYCLMCRDLIAKENFN
jgi:hypothetical protein